MSATNPIANLSSAASGVAGSIHAIADRIDQIGTDEIARALERLRLSADACRERLTDAVASAAAIARALVGDLADLTAGVGYALAEDLLPVLSPASNDQPVALPPAIAGVEIREDDGDEVIDLRADEPTSEPVAITTTLPTVDEPASEPVASIAACSPVEAPSVPVDASSGETTDGTAEVPIASQRAKAKGKRRSQR